MVIGTKRRVALGIALGGLAAAACQVVAGIEHVEKQQRAANVDASNGGDSGDSTSDASDPCAHVRPAAPPENDDAPMEEIPPLYLALRTIKLVPDANDRYQGFDLDGTCTCDKREGTAHNGESSCVPKGPDCDSNGGIDNAATKLFETFAPSGWDPDESANRSLAKGERGLLLYITKYNGKPNDLQIEVGAMISHGIVDGSGCGTTPDPENNKAPPGWCGYDKWTYSPAHARPGTKEPTFRGVGYVSNGELVFASENDLDIFFNSTVLTFGSPIASGRLTFEDGKWKLDGVLAGRIPVRELLRAVGNFESDGSYLCKSPLFVAGVVPTVCKTVDIMASSAFDLRNPKLACNAVSATIRFTAEQADVGDELLEEEAPAGCNDVPASVYECPP